MTTTPRRPPQHPTWWILGECPVCQTQLMVVREKSGALRFDEPDAFGEEWVPHACLGKPKDAA